MAVQVHRMAHAIAVLEVDRHPLSQPHQQAVAVGTHPGACGMTLVLPPGNNR